MKVTATPGGPAAPGTPGAEGRDLVFVRERSRLEGLAYRLLGSVADAEDVVADVYLRWRRVDPGAVANPAAYLTTMVTRRSLDRLRAQSRARRHYVGPWLPEPVPTAPEPDPADAVILAESLTLGFLTVIDRLDPLERAAFLLHDVFAEPYPAVAAAIGRSEAACRQLVHRARGHLAAERRARLVDPQRRDALLEAFGAALVSGDLDGLQRCLTDDVVLVSDGGAKRRAARHPVLGPHRVGRFLINLAKRIPPGSAIEAMTVNFEPAVAVRAGASIRFVMVVECDGAGVRAVRLVVNPDKLGAVDRHLGGGHDAGGSTVGAMSEPMSPSRPDAAPEGLVVENIEAWYRQNLPGAVTPLRFERLAGGHSNLTYRVTDAAGAVTVLRRPPIGELLPSAHDMFREYRVITALAPTPVPVAPSLGFCDDLEVTGGRFYVMGFVEGRVLHELEDVEAFLPLADRRRAGQSLVEVAADLHALDVSAIGLGDLGKHEGYMARVLSRWYQQYQASRGATPGIDRLYQALADKLPAQQRVSVVHGDYRLGNCITAAGGNVAAVLDWEICTLGDPLADLGYLLAMWPEEGETFATTATSPSSLPGFPTRAEMVAHYAAHSALDLADIDVYVAFSFWKVACINQGVWNRYDLGQKSSEGVDVASIRASVDQLAELAEAALESATP